MQQEFAPGMRVSREKDPIDGEATNEHIIKKAHTSIGIPSLNVEDRHLEEYTDVLMQFWDEINNHEIIMETKENSDVE